MASTTAVNGLGAAPASRGSTAALKSNVSWWSQYTRWRPTSKDEAVAAEEKLLAVRSGNVPVKVEDVGLPSGHSMHTYISKHSIPARSTPMVCVPGYGAGIGFFWKNLQGLSSQSDLYAVDPLGTGLSSRPRFSAKSTGEAEDFFVNALSEWRKAVGVDKMVLVGHSMGGYLATVYALKHPEHVKHLVLVSPAGIPAMPEDWEPKGVKSPLSVSGLLWRAAKATWNSGLTLAPSPAPWALGVQTWCTDTLAADSGRLATHPATVCLGLAAAGAPNPGPDSPCHLHLRGQGLDAQRHTGEGLTDEEVDAFREYQYHILAQQGSGEHALRHILQPFAWAWQ
eukprot:CAMPEP_0117675862 /NCGR_PEP_ID=MMETSP0804-20121206/15843_1 /TAXON_ID=1074897 /ORGANISM="Tetraselmis astigmatica, Strain CCMP880" /LENGTH=338 /DNA_ID=CAMNT_0005484917 /DNA_START=392 /DNA_END=1406 /DNA_ORIENTATION=-